MAQECIPRFPLEEYPVGKMAQHVDRSSELPYDSVDPALLSLSMAFVPRQVWETPYDNETALSRGTIFPVLDKPFCGLRCDLQKGVLR